MKAKDTTRKFALFELRWYGIIPRYSVQSSTLVYVKLLAVCLCKDWSTVAGFAWEVHQSCVGREPLAALYCYSRMNST